MKLYEVPVTYTAGENATVWERVRAFNAAQAVAKLIEEMALVDGAQVHNCARSADEV